jgi:hypothetical protein
MHSTRGARAAHAVSGRQRTRPHRTIRRRIHRSTGPTILRIMYIMLLLGRPLRPSKLYAPLPTATLGAHLFPPVLQPPHGLSPDARRTRPLSGLRSKSWKADNIRGWPRPSSPLRFVLQRLSLDPITQALHSRMWMTWPAMLLTVERRCASRHGVVRCAGPSRNRLGLRPRCCMQLRECWSSEAETDHQSSNADIHVHPLCPFMVVECILQSSGRDASQKWPQPRLHGLKSAAHLPCQSARFQNSEGCFPASTAAFRICASNRRSIAGLPSQTGIGRTRLRTMRRSCCQPRRSLSL